MSKDLLSLETGEILEQDVELTLGELCKACHTSAEQVFQLVDEGIIEPYGREPTIWRFSGVSVRRVRCVQRLEQDLGVNVAGAALALELIEELEHLRTRLRRLGDE